MKEPQRLLDGAGSAFERELLGTAIGEPVPPEVQQRMAVALGLLPGAGALGGFGSAAAESLAPPAVGPVTPGLEGTTSLGTAKTTASAAQAGSATAGTSSSTAAGALQGAASSAGVGTGATVGTSAAIGSGSAIGSGAAGLLTGGGGSVVLSALGLGGVVVAAGLAWSALEPAPKPPRAILPPALTSTVHQAPKPQSPTDTPAAPAVPSGSRLSGTGKAIDPASARPGSEAASSNTTVDLPGAGIPNAVPRNTARIEAVATRRSAAQSPAAQSPAAQSPAAQSSAAQSPAAQQRAGAAPPPHLASRKAAPTNAPSASNSAASAGDVAGEVRLLDLARRQLAAGDPTGALNALERYRQEYPQGVLTPEAAVLRSAANASN